MEATKLFENTKTRSLFFKELRKLWEYNDLMYTEKSNAIFDETCFDALYSQLRPLGEMLNSEEINQTHLNEIKRLVKEVKQFYKTTQKLVEPNWIFG